MIYEVVRLQSEGVITERGLPKLSNSEENLVCASSPRRRAHETLKGAECTKAEGKDKRWGMGEGGWGMGMEKENTVLFLLPSPILTSALL